MILVSTHISMLFFRFIFFFKKIVVYLTSLCVNWAFFGTRGPLKRSFQFTHERVEYKVFFVRRAP
jgi:hypothetical protein